MKPFIHLLCIGLVAAGSACSLYEDDGDGSEPIDRCHPSSPVVDPSAPVTHYIIDSFDLPNRASEANQYGVNLDGDEQGRPDNAVGQILSTFSHVDGVYDLDAEHAALIESGEILQLLEVRAGNLEDVYDVGVTLVHGLDTDDDPSNNLNGSGVFTVDTERGQGRMYGCVAGGNLDVQRGTIPVAITLPGLDEPFIVDVVAARIDAVISETGIAGRMAGAIREQQVTDEVIPFFAAGLERVIARDCTGCTCTGLGAKVLEYVDTDGSCSITVEEVQSSDVVRSFFSPDVDLFDADGNYAPLTDYVKDSLSIGVRFTAVPAVLR